MIAQEEERGTAIAIEERTLQPNIPRGEMDLMDSQDVARQTKVEHELLQHLIQGLQATVAWQMPEPDASRKLSTLRFIGQSFQRHLEHLLAIEEYEGYMGLVQQSSPRLGRTIDALKTQHEHFRTEAPRIVLRLERLSNTDLAGLGQVCDDLLTLLGQIEEHNRKEMALIQEAFKQDEGGGEG
jgi:hemerythrin-like domain-containing protein